MYINFTKEEMQTLLWCVQAKAAEESRKLLQNGKAPSQDETIQRLNAISKKAYIQLTA